MARAHNTTGAQGLFEKLRITRYRYDAACAATNKARKQHLLPESSIEDASQTQSNLLERLDALETATEELLESLPNYRWERELRLLYFDDCQVSGIARTVGVHRRTVYRDLKQAFTWMDNKMKLNESA